MNRISIIFTLVLLVIANTLKAGCLNDSAAFKLNSTPKSQKLQSPNTSTPQDSVVKLHTFKPDPLRSVWMGAIIPGYGQILNRKYWKLPLVYGGFLGCAYALSWNGTMYSTYQKAYKDYIDTDPSTTSYLDILPKGVTIDDIGASSFRSSLKSKQDFYRRYRDMSILSTIGFYALTLVDAYVDAQLYDYDISTDLSLRLQPTLINSPDGQKSLAMQCCIRLK